ncbi:MAG: Fic family protein [Myxococcota bacterium]|jgi:Fic family protein
MKLPEPTPQPSIEGEVMAEFFRVFDRAYIQEANRRYLPWSEFKYRALPVGCTLEPGQVWSVLDLLRRSGSAQLPLLDKNGVPFRLLMDEWTYHQVLAITAAASDPFDQSPIDAGARGQVVANALMEEGIFSSLMEGAATTPRAAKEMLRQGRSPNDRSERMIVNNYRTMQMLGDKLDQPLTVDLIRELHANVTAGTLDDAGDEGRIQQPGETRVFVAGTQGHILHEPPAAAALPQRLSALCDFANDPDTLLPAPVRAILVHFQFAYEHPFVDGNGRTARALFYWMMLKRGFPLFECLTISREFNESKRKYGMAFVHSEQSNDLTYFVRHHLEVVNQSREALTVYLRKRRAERHDADQTLAQFPDLALSQRLVLKSVLNAPGTVVTGKAYATEFQVSHPTALKHLAELVELGLMARRKRGRAFTFVGSANLKDLLGKSSST